MLIDGREDGSLAANDRGLAYGDGLFRTIELLSGVPVLWPWHWQRLQADCAALLIPQPDERLLLSELKQVAAGRARVVAKIVLTRGPGLRGYAMPAQAKITRIVSANDWSGYPSVRAEQGVAVRWCDLRLAVQPRLAGIKHLNRLENVLARSEWDDPELAEGLMLDMDGFVVEGTMSNLFLFRHGVLATPLLDRCGVAGAMRACVMDHALRLGLAVREMRIVPEALLDAEEVFICNSLAGIWPVRSLDGRVWEPGKVSRTLQHSIFSIQPPSVSA